MTAYDKNDEIENRFENTEDDEFKNVLEEIEVTEGETEKVKAEIIDDNAENIDPYTDYAIKLYDDSENEVELSFQIKKYLMLKSKLKTSNLKNALLEASDNYDYEVLAQVIKTFAVKEYKADEIFGMIDRTDDKQILFLAFIHELGEYGFFEKISIKELKDTAGDPRIDMGEMINKVMPQAISDMMKRYTGIGANTLQSLPRSVTRQG